MQLIDKLSILADAAKYDASCASSGAPKRSSEGKGGLGSTNGMGICHSYTPDGRCVSLLKILLTNFCLFDCQYCVNRRSSDVPRARFTPEEVVRLTVDFYRRNCISGLFLSSGIIRSADYTMEQLIRVARLLREEHQFRGYIHLKTIPEADPALIAEAGRYADRLSVNIELPTDASLQTLAPEKDVASIKKAMSTIYTGQQTVLNEPRAPRFTPAGQSTQMIVGADQTDDSTILHSAESLYGNFGLKRVYYSAFSPIPNSPKSVPLAAPPLMREHRLYQADFLLRSYGYKADELLSGPGDLALDIDPKLAWALENRSVFPLDLNRAEPALIARIPGIGLRTTKRLVELRRQRRIRYEDLTRLRCVLAKAKPFFITSDYHPQQAEISTLLLRDQLRDRPQPQQLGLWG
ncbi:putative DNA modification/repair radical SAM protein [Pseudomonas sp. CFBP 8770]|jgi:putative DNA modification/repair radical SAM protein|uniref:Putative DNA modification/repair radical SAM protein n=1 Tax=Pseudomonas baltica TaxID=2762576 RepID=A0A7X1KUE8_9PSED|nr:MULTISPECIES: putative DNA modification/repair radical SAM protein [Pseudomonas]MBC2679739.1 putative DNA modification/repair radical SAM protein [Pseudomonas baltica]MBD8473804.1 putative DNA modification/repair radical SAM protein [Pseudomonas sp. CFBP 8773]MBD8595230.1 putative DNA modification/repair radical SAM protein [Pseudomonas sp. CFBP 8758]MBD8603070.1 putative DNA modification/repair radical SAM protein [Pseudomonas sp. CFBP 8771]MBD8646933.1 putative DNA modification/repair rad